MFRSVLIAAVGRERDAHARSLFDRYAERLPWPLTLREVEARKADPGPARQTEEGDLLLAAAGEAVIVALDERGQDLGSDAFARKLASFRDDGARDLAFLIGGADGHGEPVRRRARLTIAFGRATWPHLLVRVMLAEQLYRAHTILAGHPYHRA